MSFVNPVVVAGGIFFLIAIARSIVIISESERGAVVRLGKYIKTLAPGFHLRVPVIDQVTKVDLDASVPGWQALSERGLETAVESFVTLGAAAPAKSRRSRSAGPDGSSTAAEAQALAGWLLKAAAEQTGVDLSNDPMARSRITERAQAVLQELTSSGSCEISLPFLTADRNGPKHFSCSLTRAQVEGILGSPR
jgi:regulator of protease activity HflC (stomatin/prohibitin superfamily)